jgi:FixJ family two-component response regulator
MTDRGPIVHVVDDDDSVRTAVQRLLQAAGYEARGYASAGEFLLGRSDRDAPGCVVLDVRMPGPSGLDLQEALARLEVPVPIVFLTGHGDIPTSVRAMKAGAVDFLTKPVSREALLTAVRSALARDTDTRAARARVQAWHSRYSSLTPREREVFAGVVAGKLNKQIAAELGTAERTVKAHRAQVMEKMQVASLAELVHVAEQLQAAAPSPLRAAQR